MKRITKLLAFTAALSCSRPVEVALAHEQVPDLSTLSAVCTGQFVNSAAWQEVRFAVLRGRYVCVESLSSQNGDSWTSAAEIEALQPDGTNMDRKGWSIAYASSEEWMGEDGEARNVLDGQPNTIWHTKWKYASPSHPHYMVIDLGRQLPVSGLRILPRQDGSSNGRIKDFRIYIGHVPFPMKDKPKPPPEKPPEAEPPPVHRADYRTKTIHTASGWTPLQLSAGSSHQLVNAKKDVYGLRLGIGSENQSVNGIDISAFYVVDDRSGSGIKLCLGLALIPENNFTGIQASLLDLGSSYDGIDVGLVHWYSEDLNGIQGGLINISGSLRGAQLGVVNWLGSFPLIQSIEGNHHEDYNSAYGVQLGVINVGARDSIGLQVGGVNGARKMQGITVGVLNLNGEKSRCIQIGGFNWSKELYGMQAGLINSDYFGETRSFSYTCGVQVGILNIPYNVCGLQIGLYNEAETLTGIQVGLVNIVYDGRAPFFFPLINARF